MIWYSPANRQRQPWPPTRPFLVAVELDGHCMVLSGVRDRKEQLRAAGVNAEPYAWAYTPDPPMQKDVRP